MVSTTMALALISVVAVAVGALVGRWWAAGVAGLIAAATTLLVTSAWGGGDSPFISVGILVVVGTSIGVMARRRLRAARY